MIKRSRRDYLKTSLGILAAGSVYGLNFSCKEKLPNTSWKMNKAICNESMQEWEFSKQCDFAAETGYQGIEIASFTLTDSVTLISKSQRGEMLKALKNAGIDCVGLHWLLAPPPYGLHATTPDSKVRSTTWAYFDQLIDFCGDLGGTVMIFGSPKQRNSVGITKEEATKYLTEGLASAADHAQNRGVKILLEPLSSDQTDVINTLAEAVDVVERINHPAIQTMFDFHNTADEIEPHDVLIRKYYKFIHHVHVQEMDGKYLGAGSGNKDFLAGFKVLKDKGYDEWVSLEVFDFSPGPEVIAKESIKVLQEIEHSV